MLEGQGIILISADIGFQRMTEKDAQHVGLLHRYTDTQTDTHEFIHTYSLYIYINIIFAFFYIYIFVFLEGAEG